MKTRVRLPYPALLVLAMATTLVAGPAGASLYMHETPGTELVGIRLSFMAAPVGGANQTGQIRSLIIDAQTAEGYRVEEHSCTATRLGREVTIHVGGLFFFGANRLDGRIGRGSLSLSAPASDGTIRRTSFTEVSEDRWNAAVVKFKRVARLVRLGDEFRSWSNEEQQACARLTENKRGLADAKVQQVKADEALQRATADLESGERRLEAAEKVREAAAALADACERCDSGSAIRSAGEVVREAREVVAYEAAHIRDDEAAAPARLDSAQRKLEEKTHEIQGGPASSEDNSHAGLATGRVQQAVGHVEGAVGHMEVAVGQLEVNEAQTSSAARNAADLVRAFQKAITDDNLRIQEAKQQQAAISRTGTALAQKLGLGKKRPQR
jgi:hypothetical protein